MSPTSSSTALIRSIAWPEPAVIRMSSVEQSMPRSLALVLTNSRKPRCPCEPWAAVYIASLEPSLRNALAVASISPSTGISVGSLCPPMKLYFG